MSTLYCIGIGPGAHEQMSLSARNALEAAEFIVGYRKYVHLLEPLISNQEIFTTGMKQEKERAEYALEQARTGRTGAIVSSGDACIYGIGGLVLELASEEDFSRITFRIIPGLTASVSAASLLGAPLMNDYVSLSLSDLLTDRQTILRRIHLACEGDFVLVLYNPTSKNRHPFFLSILETICRYRNAETPVGIVTSAYRSEQEVTLTRLAHVKELEGEISMNTVLIVGNSHTYIKGNHMITPRGYV